MEMNEGRREDERRRESRHEVMLDGKIRLPLPEVGGATLVAKLTVENLSRHGARVLVRSLKKHHVGFVTKGNFKCSVLCQLPGTFDPSFLSGTVVWTDISSETTRLQARLGIHLTDTEPPEHECLGNFLKGFEAQG